MGLFEYVQQRRSKVRGLCEYMPCDNAPPEGKLYCSKECEAKTHRYYPLSGWEKIAPDPRDVRKAMVRRGFTKSRGKCGKCGNTIIGGAGKCYRGGRWACDARGCDGCTCCFKNHSKAANSGSKD